MTETLEVGDLILLHTTDPFARAIQVFTLSPYNHVACYIGEVKGVPTAIEAHPTGITETPVSTWDLSDPAKALIVKFPLTDAQRKKAVIFWYTLLGLKYGWIDIFAMLFTRLGFKAKWLVNRAKSDKRWVCSQVATGGFAAAGFEIPFDPAREDWAASPSDIANAYLLYKAAL
jgi:uncharacterized protein YycO